MRHCRSARGLTSAYAGDSCGGDSIYSVTQNKINTMTPEQQQIAIAKAVGWKLESAAPGLYPQWRHPNGQFYEPPDYLNDLNAMREAEAEKVLTGQQEYDYATAITGGPGRPDSFFKILHATAAQRAEAFLRTLGKWTS